MQTVHTRVFRSIFKRSFSNSISSGIPRTGLILYARPVTDTIGLSADDYDNISATWQAIFFTDPTTPVEFSTFADLWTAVSAESTLNDNEVMGTEAKGVAIYESTTSRTILNKALRYFGLPLVYNYFMEDSELWPLDTDLWPED